MQMVTKRSTAAHISACSHPHPVAGSIHPSEGPYDLQYWLCPCGHHWTEHSVKKVAAVRTYPLQAQAVAL